MRNLLVTIALLALVGCTGCASGPRATRGVKQVAPLSETVFLVCSKFKAALVTLPDGTIEPLEDEDAARAVYDSLPDGHAAIVNSQENCAPTQDTLFTFGR